MDIDMKELDGIAATRLIKAANPSMRVLMLSALSDADSVLRALEAGASGYLLKECAVADLAAAMEAVMAGETYLSPKISAHVVTGLLAAKAGMSAPLLTGRQSEILTLIAKGNSTKQIAFLLEVSAKTVETHRSNIMERLEIRDVAGLVVYAIRSRLIDIGVAH
jgi:DNA-binding NarL/FixJ family response regulator